MWKLLICLSHPHTLLKPRLLKVILFHPACQSVVQRSSRGGNTVEGSQDLVHHAFFFIPANRRSDEYLGCFFGQVCPAGLNEGLGQVNSVHLQVHGGRHGHHNATDDTSRHWSKRVSKVLPLLHAVTHNH